MTKKIALLIFGFTLINSICLAENTLQLSIKVNKKSFKPGDTIKIEYTFNNKGKENLVLCKYDIEHILKENTLFQLTGGVIFQLKDWTKRKMPIVSKDDFVNLKPGGKYKIKILFKTIYDEDDSWRYVKNSKKTTWGVGDKKLKKGIYKISCNFKNEQGSFHVNKEKKEVWTGNISSHSTEIKIK